MKLYLLETLLNENCKKSNSSLISGVSSVTQHFQISPTNSTETVLEIMFRSYNFEISSRNRLINMLKYSDDLTPYM